MLVTIGNGLLVLAPFVLGAFLGWLFLYDDEDFDF